MAATTVVNTAVPEAPAVTATNATPTPTEEENPNPDAFKHCVLPDRYKTQLCRAFEKTGTCKYVDHCAFAHGPHELRTREQNRAAGLASRPAAEVQKERKGVAKAADTPAPAAAATTDDTTPSSAELKAPTPARLAPAASRASLVRGASHQHLLSRTVSMLSLPDVRSPTPARGTPDAALLRSPLALCTPLAAHADSPSPSTTPDDEAMELNLNAAVLPPRRNRHPSLPQPLSPASNATGRASVRVGARVTPLAASTPTAARVGRFRHDPYSAVPLPSPVQRAAPRPATAV